MSTLRRGLFGSRPPVPSYLCATSRRNQRSSVSRGHQGVELPEGLASELLGRDRQPTSLSVGVAKAPATKLLSKHRVLGEQVLGDLLVVSGHPTSGGQQQELKG
jgi:hypothetical protein